MNEKVSKESVGYSQGHPGSRCGICKFYREGTCTKVKGIIRPDYWCKLFKKK